VAALLLLSVRIVRAQSEDAADGTCPIGLDGESCRNKASAEHTWKAFEGCAIPSGDDLGDSELLTVKEAQERCGSLELCQGFTFEGNDADGPLSGDPVWMHFKQEFDCIDAEWISYRKLYKSSRRAAAPAPPPPPPSESLVPKVASNLSVSGQGVALCFNGQVRMLQTTHQAVQQNLLDVLRPDIFMYGPADRGVEDELFGLRKYVAATQFDEHEDIRGRLYSETKNPSRMIDLEYVQIQGNWLGSQCLDPPLSDNRPGSAICMYYNQQKCLDMIQEHELERGHQYEWVVVSRTDFRWLAPHPPLDVLAEKDGIWIPSGSDWEGGINDRHAVMRRKDAETYLGAWKTITQGMARDVMLETLGSMKVNGYPGPNTESFLKARLQFHGVTVQRFPNVAYLTCTQRMKSRWTQCSGTSSNDSPGWLYKEEMEHATRVAKCVRTSWSSKKMSECWDDISHLYRGFR